MCLNACNPIRDYPRLHHAQHLSKKTHPRVAPTVRMRRLVKTKWGRKRSQRERRVALEKKKMVNLKLFSENKRIMAENERLRAQAFVLRQENQALLSQLLTDHHPAAVLFAAKDGGVCSS